MLVIFSVKNIKRDKELNLTYLNAGCIMQMRHLHDQISKWNVKGGQKGL